MKILSADFVTSAAAGGRVDGIPRDGIAQVAFAGRSNVGKSTLLNALVRKKIARTSAAPGKTRLANIFRVVVDGGPGGAGRWNLYLVDLPGYGYARGGESSAQELAAVASAYFAADERREGDRSRAGPGSVRPQADPSSSGSGSVRLQADPPSAARHALLLVDSRHPGLEADRQAHEWLSSCGVAPYVIATKIDKLSRAERVRNLRELEHIFGNPVLPVSAAGGEGMDQLWKLIARLARNSTA